MTDEPEARARFEALYTETRVALLGYLARRTANAEDATDLLADVYVVAWRRLETVPQGSEALLYLYGVARNVVGNHRRGERRADRLFDRLRTELAMHISATRTVDPAISDPTLMALNDALSALDPVDHELITLNVWEGLSPTEIAAVTERSVGSVRVRLHRTRQAVRAQLEAQGVQIAADPNPTAVVPYESLEEANPSPGSLTRHYFATGGLRRGTSPPLL